MPAKEIKELRHAGKLEEAYAMAKAELDVDLSNIWGKRNLSWVLYAQLDALASNLPDFLLKLNELKELELPASEEMLFDNISIVLSKAARAIVKSEPLDLSRVYKLFDAVKPLPLKRNSKWFGALYAAFHKGLKESPRYIEFADWWNFENFQAEAYQKEKMPNGREIMAIAEQAYIAYAKHLLPIRTSHGEVIFNKEKAEAFLPKLTNIAELYPQFQYPAYFVAKLLLALGDKENMLSALLPFAKRKMNDFWVWEILGEAFSDDADKVFACYCKALSCQSPEEMLVNLRQKMASILINKKLFAESKTEIELLVKARTLKGYKIPNEVVNWQSQGWYKTTEVKKSNANFYKQYTGAAEAILFMDVPEETVMVDFVNTDRKILNFIASDTKYGFFKYERFLRDVNVGDTFKVRFQGGSAGGIHQVYTVSKVRDEDFIKGYKKEVTGEVKITLGKPFGFLGDIFIHPALVTKLGLVNGIQLNGTAIKTFNQEKKQWGWKLITVNTEKS